MICNRQIKHNAMLIEPIKSISYKNLTHISFILNVGAPSARELQATNDAETDNSYNELEDHDSNFDDHFYSTINENRMK